MKIVILSDMLPYPLNSGGAQAVFNMLNGLRARHEITFVFPQSQKNSIANKKQLERLLSNVDFKCYPYWRQLLYWKFLRDKTVRALRMLFAPRGKQLLIDRALKPYGIYFTYDFKRFLNAVINSKDADVFQAEFYNCLPAINHIEKDVRTVFVHHEVRFVRNERLLQIVPLTMKERILKDKSKNSEISDLNKYDVVVTLTENDKNVLKQNGVSTYIKVSPAAINTIPRSYKSWTNKIVFLGSYAHLPNREGLDWFAKSVLPLMDLDVGSHINIIGSGWNESYKSKYGFVLKGFVEDLTDEAYGAIMMIPLLTGSGMRMKILEASAMSIPFITTSVGVEGLLFKDGEDCIIADSPQDFANGLKRLMADENLRKELAMHAHLVFMENYSIEKLANIRDEVYNDKLN